MVFLSSFHLPNPWTLHILASYLLKSATKLLLTSTGVKYKTTTSCKNNFTPGIDRDWAVLGHSVMGSNNIKVHSRCKNEQHRGAPWKLNKELTWTNHFGVSLRDKPQYLLLGMSGTALWPPVVRSKQWFFMLKGIFIYIYIYLVGGVALGLDYLSYAFSNISVWRALTCECAVEIYITPC